MIIYNYATFILNKIAGTFTPLGELLM